MPKETQLADFWKLLEEYKRLVWWSLGSSAVPIAAALASLTPAWPSGVAGVTAVAQLLATVFAFQMLKSSRKRIVTRFMVRGALVLCLLFSIYLLLIALFNYTEPQSKVRYTKGFECTQEALLVFGSKCPFLGLDEIAKANYEEERMWTSPSVSIMKVFIVVMWLACFVTLSVILASFIIFQTGQR